jgi:hypothetical protein
MAAAIQLQRLKQTGSARDYSMEFLQPSKKLTRETYLASAFSVGLKDEIQAEIYELGALPTIWEAMTERAKLVESQLHKLDEDVPWLSTLGFFEKCDLFLVLSIRSRMSSDLRRMASCGSTLG